MGELRDSQNDTLGTAVKATTAVGVAAGTIATNVAAASAKKSSKPRETQPVRARNEDDDGYDPYSDFHDRPVSEPLFERDPWS